jgi:hypothetical protein
MAVVRLSTTARNAMADSLVDLLDAGTGAATIQIRSGSMPATPQTAATGTLLATVTLADPAAGSAATGVATISDPASVTGAADGTAGWARILDSSNNVVMDCDVTATGGGGAITLNTVTISTGVSVDLGAITVTVPQG